MSSFYKRSCNVTLVDFIARIVERNKKFIRRLYWPFMSDKRKVVTNRICFVVGAKH